MFLIQKTIFHYHGSPWHLLRHWLPRPFVLHEIMVQFALAAGITLGGVMALQLAYPRSLALPQTRIGGQGVGFRSKAHIATMINQLNDEQVEVIAGDQTLKPKVEDLGARLEGAKDAQTATSYSLRERLVPFSLFFVDRTVDHYSYRLDEDQARSFLKSLERYNKPPIDAKIKLEGASAIVEKSSEGYIYDVEVMLPELRDLELKQDMSLALHPKVVEPALSDESAQQAVNEINQRLDASLQVQVGGKSITIEPATLASWVVVTADTQKKTFGLSYDRAKIKAALAPLASQVYIAPTTGSMILLDGETTGRSEGGNGRGLALDASADAIIAALDKNQTSAQAVAQTIAPSSRVTRTYSRSSKGIQALMNYWAQSNGGTYGIALRSLDGQISANYNGGRRFTSASIYKLYLAYVVYTKVGNGEMSLDEQTSTGASVGTCIDVMIVRSDNPCAVALGNKVGWQANDGMLHAKGFGSTTLSGGGLLTSANDTVSYLTQLQGGSLVSSGHTAALLSMMNRQIYRSGIPAGSSGGVANKVGFLSGLNHDAAIVYHPKGSYALVVLSSGSSFSRIADLSRQISAVMNQ